VLIPNGPKPPYTWSQLPSFSASRKALEDDVNEWDVFQWAIEDVLCWDPYAIVNSVGDGTDRLYFKTWRHPGTASLPRLIVIFRIDKPPTDIEPGLIEGHLVFRLGALNGGGDEASPLDALQ
jgi:hypothetical protein